MYFYGSDMLHIFFKIAETSQWSVLGPTLFYYDIPTFQNCQLAIYTNNTVVIQQQEKLESSIYITDIQNYNMS